MYKVFTVILVVCQAVILFFPLLFKTPLRINLMPLVALAMLWLNWFFLHGKSGTSALGVVLWVLFAVICLQVLSPTVLAMFAVADRGKTAAPVIIGKADSPKAIAMVYHPGASNLPKTVNTMIAERLARNGFKVTLYTANARLSIDPKRFSAVGLSSPVYLGVIRPPLFDFITKTDLAGIKCFITITGLFKSSGPVDTEKVKTLVESKGGIVIGGSKFASSSLSPEAHEIEAFVDGIKNKL